MAPIACKRRAAGRRPAAAVPDGARRRGSPENSKSSSRARFSTRIGSRGSEGASELTEGLPEEGVTAEEEIGRQLRRRAALPAVVALREWIGAEERCERYRGLAHPLYGGEGKGRKRARQWAAAPGGAGGGARRDITGEGDSRLRGTVCDTDWTGSKGGTVRSSPAAL
jgi:hypothetical protein